MSWRQRRKWMMADPATSRDLLWMIVGLCAGAALASGSAAAIVYGVFGMALPHGSTQLAGVISHPLYGILLAVFGFWAAPWLLRGYGEFARSLLGPTRQAELAQRVRSLAQSRADTIDTGAAEMRRIERGLHDGAQARLVAMGMTMDAAGQLLDTSRAARGPCWPRPGTARSRPWSSCGTWSGASSRRCWPTAAWSTRSARWPSTARCGWR